LQAWVIMLQLETSSQNKQQTVDFTIKAVC